MPTSQISLRAMKGLGELLQTFKATPQAASASSSITSRMGQRIWRGLRALARSVTGILGALLGIIATLFPPTKPHAKSIYLAIFIALIIFISVQEYGRVAVEDEAKEESERRHWWKLSARQKHLCLLDLQGLKVTSIGIAYNPRPEQDCELLASDLREIFVSAGWKVMFFENMAMAAGSMGVTLHAQDPATGKAVTEAIEKALGINVSLREVIGPSEPNNLLIVGSRRRLDTQQTP